MHVDVEYKNSQDLGFLAQKFVGIDMDQLQHTHTGKRRGLRHVRVGYSIILLGPILRVGLKWICIHAQCNKQTQKLLGQSWRKTRR